MSTPHDSLNSHWLLGWFTLAIDPGHGEFLFGQQRDHQVVLVVTRGRHGHVDLRHARRVEGADLAGVGRDPRDVDGGAQALDEVGVPSR